MLRLNVTYLLVSIDWGMVITQAVRFDGSVGTN